MKIVLLIGSLSMGGAERQFIYTANGLASRGHDVAVIIMRRGAWDEMVTMFSPEIRLVRLGRTRKLDFWFVYPLLRALKQINPDVIYSYLDSANILSVVISPLFSAEIVWGVRSARKKVDTDDSFGDIRNFALDRLSGIPNLYISNSVEGARIKIERGFRAERFTVIPNGIDTSVFRIAPEEGQSFRRGIGVKDDEILVGIVASIRPVKDHWAFLKMARQLVESEPKYRFVIVGKGEASYIARLQLESRDLGISDRILWLGHRDRLVDLYNGIDVLVSSSTAEGFSNSIAEAMACGTPVVATRVGDSSVIIGDKGMIAEAGDSMGLANSVISVVDRRRSGFLPPNEIRSSIVNRFSLESLGKATEEQLRRLVESE